MADNILEKIIHPGPRGKIWRLFIIILLLVFFASLVDAGSYYNRGSEWLNEKTGGAISLPKVSEKPFRLGLDLLGGTHLVYRADMSDIPAKDRVSALEGVRDVIERRVNVFGVSEPVVQTNITGNEYRVIVELAGIKDVNQAIKMIGETPLLEFKEQDNTGNSLSEEQKSQIEKFNQEAKDKAVEVLGKVLNNGDFSALAKEYSDDDKTKDNGGNLGWITQSDHPDIISHIKNLEPGQTTTELIETAAGYEIYKLNEKRKKTNPFDESQVEKEVKAAHLLICYEGSESCSSGLTKEEAYKKIKELKTKATPQNFSELVKENSTEPGAATTGGDLGWFDRKKMVKPFADAVFNQKVGTISFVVETKFGYHLIYKEDERDIEEYNVSHILIKKISKEQVAQNGNNWKNTALSGKNLKRASVTFNPNDNTPEVSLEFDDEGAKLFADITGRNVNKPVAIFLDGEPISTPNVNEKITGGRAVISGHFNIKEAKLLAQRLNAGALPVPISIISQQTVGASLGKVSLDDSLRAAIIGLVLVALFMIAVYRLSGFLAVISLLFYGIFVLAVFKLWPVTLTLSGLAGFILSVGMAVDANVLIFERLKEEIRAGKPLDLAIPEAFTRAWPSIRDGNVSTLLTCFILIQFSTSIVKGFAITLGIGVIISMFSAIIITKNLIELFYGPWLEKRGYLLGIKNK